LKGESAAAKDYRQKILLEPSTLTGSDKQALEEAKRGFNIFLIKARLDFDAGRYTKIIKDLDPKKVSAIGDEDWVYQEFYYRRARAFQELGFKDKALESFLKASSWPEPETYSLGNSLLQIAMLYEENGNPKESRRYFLRALSLKSYAFHEGVHQKARAGLERLP
jgi:tetratricopeptide (TPR) repeat protein